MTRPFLVMLDANRYTLFPGRSFQYPYLGSAGHWHGTNGHHPYQHNHNGVIQPGLGCRGPLDGHDECRQHSGWVKYDEPWPSSIGASLKAFVYPTTADTIRQRGVHDIAIGTVRPEWCVGWLNGKRDDLDVNRTGLANIAASASSFLVVVPIGTDSIPHLTAGPGSFEEGQIMGSHATYTEAVEQLSTEYGP